MFTRPLLRLLPTLSITLMLAACQPTENATLTGYVEGDYVYLSSAAAGFLAPLPVMRGQVVKSGQSLFSVDSGPEEEAVAQARSQVDAANSQVQNLQAARRQSELAALKANLQSAQAALQLAEIQLKRQSALLNQKFVSASAVDAARSTRDQSRAAVASLQAQINTFEAPIGRAGEVGAAMANASSAESVVRQKAWFVAHKSSIAPQSGVITEVFYQPGEWVAAGAPVVRFLPDNNRLIRFYIPEKVRMQYQTGQIVSISCDGCGQPQQATIRFISPAAEYTPPVIYSEQNRTRLVFRAEATLTGNHPPLPLGLPVSIQASSK